MLAPDLLSKFFVPEFKMVFVVNMDLGMGRGKQCAQVAHACLGLFLDIRSSDDIETEVKVHQWLTSGQRKIVLKGDNLQHMERIQAEAKAAGLPTHIVIDAGLTQLAPGSKTVLSIFGRSDEVDKVTGTLRLL